MGCEVLKIALHIEEIVMFLEVRRNTRLLFISEALLISQIYGMIGSKWMTKLKAKVDFIYATINFFVKLLIWNTK